MILRMTKDPIPAPYAGSSRKYFKQEIHQWTIIPACQGTARGSSHTLILEMSMETVGLILPPGPRAENAFENGNYFAVYYSQDDVTKPWAQVLPGAGEQFGATHTAADVNGDGKIDILATRRGHGMGVLWFEGPTWKQHMIDDTIDSISTDFGDIDGRDIDMSTVGYESKLAVYGMKTMEGNFTRHVLSRDQMAYDTMITDLDGDGHKDILVAGQRSQNVVWFKTRLNKVFVQEEDFSEGRRGRVF